MRLAYIGSIKDDILNMEELALNLIEFLRTQYPGVLAKRYGIQEEGTQVQILEALARSRGCLKKGEELDYSKASLILFDDFPFRKDWKDHFGACLTDLLNSSSNCAKKISVALK